jgi:hypothetical protein
MVRMYIVNKLLRIRALPIAVCLLSLFALNACAQMSEHFRNETFLTEWKSVESSTVLLNNEEELVPLKDLMPLTIASVNIGSAYASEFDSILNKYTSIHSFASAVYNHDMQSFNDLNDDLKFYNTVIVQVTDQSLNDPRTIPLLLDLQLNKSLIVSLSGDAGSLKLLEALNSVIIWSEKKSAVSANFAAQLIFGGLASNARLNQGISARYALGSGFSTIPIRLKYTVPEELESIVQLSTELMISLKKQFVRELLQVRLCWW